MRHIKQLIIAGALALIAIGASADPKVADLGWMTGSWSGNAGPGVQLEENWSAPRAGTMGSIVRMVGDTTSMMEVVYIEERDGTLMLYLQQWDPGFAPRTEKAQVMRMKAMGDRKVSFKAVGEGGMRALAYSRPSDDDFVIDVTVGGGNQIQIPLKRLR